MFRIRNLILMWLGRKAWDAYQSRSARRAGATRS
jgi:hypothetical protein